MLPQIEYFRPKSIEETSAILSSKTNVKILAGGTDILVDLRKHTIDEHFFIIDISHIKSLSFITEKEDSVIIGPLVTHTELSKNAIINKFFPALSKSASTVGSPQIRNRGTIGGNICNASPAADTVPVLVALEATLTLTNLIGERNLKITEFIKAPYKTNRANDEILTKITIKKLPLGTKSSFIKLGRRNALAISRMNVATFLHITNGVIDFARISTGSVFPITQRVESVERFLIDKKVELNIFKFAGDMVGDEMVKVSGVRWSTPYKKPVISALVKRSLCECANLEVK